MPVYEYSCQDCGKRFEVTRAVTAAAGEIRCPSCGGAKLERVYSSVYAVTSKKS